MINSADLLILIGGTKVTPLILMKVVKNAVFTVELSHDDLRKQWLVGVKDITASMPVLKSSGCRTD